MGCQQISGHINSHIRAEEICLLKMNPDHMKNATNQKHLAVLPKRLCSSRQDLGSNISGRILWKTKQELCSRPLWATLDGQDVFPESALPLWTPLVVWPISAFPISSLKGPVKILCVCMIEAEKFFFFLLSLLLLFSPELKKNMLWQVEMRDYGTFKDYPKLFYR